MAEIQDVEYPTEIIAAILGVTKARIRQLSKQGLPKSGRNSYPMIACIQWYIDFWRVKATTNDAALMRHRKRLLKAQADKATLEVQEKKRELISIEEIKEQWDRVILSARNQFLALPDRLAQMLETVGTPRERQKMIDSEVKAILIGLAEGDYDS